MMNTSASPRPLSLLPLTGLLVLAATLMTACNAPSESDAVTNNAAFVTWLGNDTLAVEQFTRDDEGMNATVVLRTPETTVRDYTLTTTPEGQLERYEAVVRDPLAADGTAPLRQTVVTPEGDSLLVEITEDGETQTRRIAGGADALPFIDMVHWPFELMLTRAYATGRDSVAQPLFTTRGTQPFVVRRLAPDSMTVTHPFRGTMGVRVDDVGRLIRLDAANTTRKLVVERTSSIAIDALAETFAQRDEQGQSFGALSGRGTAEATVDGATITVDYGVPEKRGRDIFGALVPWGEVWRTGANRATHFTTDRTLQLRGLTVPAGTYTLYTIPEPDGGTLIVNRQTGQGGTTYNADRDLGRVAMTRESLPHTVEPFTIQVEDTDAGGALRLHWDQTAFVVPFTVQ